MMPRSRNWLSSVVRRDAEVNKALTELSQLIRVYEDAAKPSCCRGSGDGFLSAELDLFRPGWKLFTVIGLVCGIGGFVSSFLELDFEAGLWADLALGATVPVFVLGVSVVTLARSMSESGRFAVEYLNDSCRMPWFCCLTLIAVLVTFVGRFLVTVAWLPGVVMGGLCAAALGAAIACLAMLAFVVRETIRCSLPNESIRAVSQYAARKLCCGYLKEAHVRLLTSQHKESLERWIVGHCKAVHPPSHYYGRSFRPYLHPGEANNDCEILLDVRVSGQETYRDYDLGCLARLDSYLQTRAAELYLSPANSKSEQVVLGILSCPGVSQVEELKTEVRRLGRQAIKVRRFRFQEESDDFWDGQQSSLDEAMAKAVDRADPMQVRVYLDAVNKPLAVLRQVRRHNVIRNAYGECVRRGYDFLGLYLRALHEILATGENVPKRRAAHAFTLARVLIKSTWEETNKIVDDLDYHTMELFTWLVQQMYGAIKDSPDQGKPLTQMRAQFGGFYALAGRRLDHNESTDAESAERMRLVLHEGLTKWLLMVVERPEERELVKQLADAGRGIVFGREGITFQRGALAARQFVLAGHLMCRPEAATVGAAAGERLFCEEYSHAPDVDFGDLVTFYLSHAFPLQTLDEYLHLFFTPQTRTRDLLTGSSHSFGYGMTGVHEMALAFTYLAAHALNGPADVPEPIGDDIGWNSIEEAIGTVGGLFTDIAYGLERLKTWIEKSKELQRAEEAKAIAEAPLDDEKVEKWSAEFWKAYSASSPVLSLCLKNGNYETDNGALVELRYHLPKIAVIDWKYPITGAGGDDYGRSLARHTERGFLSEIVGKAGRPLQVEGGLPDIMATTVGWLKKEGCHGDTSLVVVLRRHAPATRLYRDECFVPSWREDVRSRGFHGFYDGFPIVWLREREQKEDSTDRTVKARDDTVVAVDLRGWRGIRVRECVITRREFGEVDVRTWTKKEIDEALEAGKLKPEEVDRAKGNCPVDVALYWQFSTEDLPRARAFEGLALAEG